MSKLLLIDGHSIINRAFYGVPELSNSSGLHVNAIYGFLNIMFKFIDDESPDYITVAFDTSAPTFRHKEYSDYKGTRKPMPEELREQVPVVKDVLKAMGVNIIMQEGIEADDILGTLAKAAEADGMEVTLVSGDRDLLQIATDRIKIALPKTKGNKTETEYYHTEDVIAKYQVPPSGIIELKSLMGDSSDNIPGVPKVGEKTATSLLVEYHTLDNIYANLDNITKKGLHDTLEQNRDKAYLSHFLATIKTDCDVVPNWSDITLGNLYTGEAYELLKTLGLKSILKRFEGKIAGTDLNPFEQNIKITSTNDYSEVEAIFKSMEKTKDVYVYIHRDKNKQATALSVGFDEKIYVIDIIFFITEAFIAEKLTAIQHKGIHIITYDVKAMYEFLDSHQDNNIDDVMLLNYLNNPVAPKEINTEPGKVILSIMEDYRDGMEALKASGQMNVYRDIDLPLAAVLYDMEQAGIRADRDWLVNYGETLDKRIVELTSLIYDKAGESFNINSPKQLGEVLFEKLKLPGGKKTKSGYSTAAEVLQKLAGEYPIVDEILEYRALTKLKSTYAQGLIDCIRDDGRIHTTFNQTVTATGRISSTEPNLQNIPIRTELGREIRKCFIPKPGYVFIDADYSQIELRLLAHMSGDESLIESYRMDADIHRITASKVFGIPFDEVTPTQRRDAKAVNFGLIYGISSFGLSKDLGITREDAARYIEDYFKNYPGVKRFLDDTVSNAKEKGYVKTMYGRVRPIPELKSSNYMMRQFGERVAMNSPIQGTAADIMKIAMIKVHKALNESGLDARILVQVHDELLLEVKEEALETAKDILIDNMINAADLKVRLDVDAHSGKDWYEAK